jgi:hypothetical protein
LAWIIFSFIPFVFGDKIPSKNLEFHLCMCDWLIDFFFYIEYMQI